MSGARNVPTSVVPAVDRSRSSPDAVAPPAVSPEATRDEQVERIKAVFGAGPNEMFPLHAAEAAPPRATTPEDDYDEGDLCGPLDPGDKRAEMIAARCAAPGDYAAVGRALCDALATLGLVEDLRLFTLDREQVCVVIESSDKDVQPENAATCALEYALRAFKGLPLTDDEKSHHIRLRAPLAGSPSLESGDIRTLLEAAYTERQDGKRGRWPAQIALEHAIIGLTAQREQAASNFDMMVKKWGESESALSTLERDAARMRGIEQAATAYIAAVDAPVGSADLIWDTRADLRRALSPSGEPTTTPET